MHYMLWHICNSLVFIFGHFQAQLNLGNRKWKDKLCMYEKYGSSNCCRYSAFMHLVTESLRRTG